MAVGVPDRGLEVRVLGLIELWGAVVGVPAPAAGVRAALGRPAPDRGAGRRWTLALLPAIILPHPLVCGGGGHKGGWKVSAGKPSMSQAALVAGR